MKSILRTIICAGFATAMLASCEKELPHRVVTPIDAPAEISLSIEGVNETIGLMAPKTKAFPITIKANTIADQLLTFTVAPNPDKVAEYNKANGTDYEMVPGDAYELSTMEFYLPRYNTVGSTGTVTIKANGLPDDGKTRVLPVSITKIEGDAETKMTAADSTVFITVFRVSLADMKFEKGSGTEADPYIVEYANDMLAMNNDLKDGEPTYIKLGADIDMSSIEEWMPVNITEPYKTIHFDGDGHTISNMYSNATTMCSLFGAITGSVKNITFKDCILEPGVDATGTGLVAGYAKDATLENITINGLRIESVGGYYNNGKHAGGLVGRADNCTIKNINVEVDFVDTEADNKMPSLVGGMVGYFEGGASTVDNCHVKGTVMGHYLAGGFAGAVAVDGMEITNSSADVALTTFKDYCGGFLGYANKGIKLTGCHASGTLTTGGNYQGGFVGACQGEAVIKKCYSSVNVTNQTNTHVGVFIGNLGKGYTTCNDGTSLGGSLVEDCYATGSLKVTAGNGNSGRMNSAFIAMIEKLPDVTVRRCYSSGSIEAEGANGPISGFIAMFKMATIPEAMNGLVEQCIAWNDKVITSTSNATTWSSGAIVGVSSNTNTYTDCYRRADMVYSENCGGTEYTLFDQENSSPTSPLAYDTAMANKCPYHGKAAPAGATCSDVAKTLNWPEDVWDLSGELPKLK